MSRGNAAGAPRRGWGTRAAGWIADIVLGMRVAMLSGRHPRSIVVRMSLATIGIGLLVAVLLLGAALLPALQARADRMAARAPVLHGDATSPTVTFVRDTLNYRGHDITAVYLHSDAADPPVPPGLRELPAPGEAVVSPAVAGMLASDNGDLLRPRLGDVVGVIDKSGLGGPADLRVYIGASGLSEVDQSRVAYGFGNDKAYGVPIVGAEQLGFVLPATGMLVVPILIFIATTSRVSGAERERRLAALRLAGGSRGQVRRVAAGESLVGLVTGSLLGTGAFFLLRELAADFSFGDVSVYPSDLATPLWCVGATVVAVPALTVAASWVGMRGTIVEPLGVVRQAKTVRRRGWWRLLLVLAGVLLMTPDLLGMGFQNPNTAVSQGIGAMVLVIGVPVLMPWLTELVVSKLGRGTSAWQLAVRRLQTDSATTTRVIAGIVVVLAVAVAMQAMFQGIHDDLADSRGNGHTVMVSSHDGGAAGRAELRDALSGVDGVREMYSMRRFAYQAADGDRTMLTVAGCAWITRSYQVSTCSDGDVFAVRGTGLHPGSTLSDYEYTGTRGRVPVRSFRLPELKTVEGRTELPRQASSDVLVTPGAAGVMELPQEDYSLYTVLEPGRNGTVARMRNALDPMRWDSSLGVVSGGYPPESAALIGKVKMLIYLGSCLIMLLAGVSLLVAATQQVADRRKALAAMNASGVPVSVLARSLLWQTAIPLSFGVVMACGIGVLVSWLAGRQTGVEVSPEWTFIGSLAAAAFGLVLAITAATLPALRSATRLDTLRTE